MSDIDTTNTSIRYDSSATEGVGKNERHSLQTYVSDMLALERHIEQPVKRQLSMEDTNAYPEANAVISQIAGLTESHATALAQCLAQLGGHEAGGVKSAWSSVLGFGAAAIDSVRKTKVSKALRDDYTALNLAAISYTMLHATAVGIGDATVAGLAKRHLADYARLVMHIAQIMPAVVLQELRDDGESVRTDAADAIRHETSEIWKGEASVTHG
jgi:ferritin-like metal-binding protein YciE